MIIVIHENNDWIPPFVEAFQRLNIDYRLWYVPDMDLDLTETPPHAVYWNRMSASSHTRGHRFEPELTAGILAWLSRHQMKVINGGAALDLEISKIRQYEELARFAIKTPSTVCAIKRDRLLKASDRIGFPLITKHNRAGKGLGVRKFDNKDTLKEYLEAENFENSPDGITLLQEYISATTQSIIRMEFVNYKFLYAVEVDTSEGFELCPAEACEIETHCPTDSQSKFRILSDFSIPNLTAFEQFLTANDIGIAGIEIIFDHEGNYWAYDVNTNTNYNPQAESLAGISAPDAIARFLVSLDY